MPKTLLLADDSVTIQKVVGISFANEDVVLITVDNGDHAIARAKESRPDLILADVVMPGKNGYEVCEAIKADPELSHIPVLLLTGTFEAFDEERAQRAGAAGHVSKPFEAQTLVDQVKRLLAASAAPAAARPKPAPRSDAALSGTAPGIPIGAITAPAAGGARAPIPAQPREIEESFDFFDDEVQELAVPAAIPVVHAATASDELDLDSAESAFAFGDDELTSLEDSALEPRVAPPLSHAPAGDRTIAILPDEPELALAGERESPPLRDDLRSFGDDDLAPFGSAFESSGSDAHADSDSLGPIAPAGAGDFDFDFESETPVPYGLASEESLVPVDAADLAQATILDPNGASGFDVSSSDLGDPLASGPTGLLASDTGPLRDSGARSAPTASPQEIGGTRLGLGAMSDALDAEPTLEPYAPSDASSDMFAATEPSASTPIFARAEIPPPIPETDPALEAFAPLIEAEPLLAITHPEPIDEPEYLPTAEARTAAISADAITAAALEQISPKLRAQIHDTLEKIAWESFSDLTETIVRQAVERVEQVAWEVIPQLAETLVREEIRRMKGEES